METQAERQEPPSVIVVTFRDHNVKKRHKLILWIQSSSNLKIYEAAERNAKHPDANHPDAINVSVAKQFPRIHKLI